MNAMLIFTQSLRLDGKPAYLDVQPLRSGWGSPT